MPTVLQAIVESNTIASLLARMEDSKRCLELALRHIPLGLHTSVTPGPLSDGEWCILISNASAVVKLKQLVPIMISTIQSNGINVQSIRLKRSY
ncbi:MAG: hypothetical protein QM533_13325 [Cytophagales bacterium]|nr:hypothetical protein [Cytophagales bacterium]